MSFQEFKNFEFHSDILAFLHHGNFRTFLRMGKFSDILSLPKQENLEFLGRFSYLVSRNLKLISPVKHFMSFINLFQIHNRSSKNNCRNKKIHQTSFFVQNSHFSSDSSFHPILNSLKFIRFCSFSNTIYISVCISSMALLYFPSLEKG